MGAKLTFRGFLRRYCAELAGTETSSLARLCRIASGEAPRVAEPLFLLAWEAGKLVYLLRLSEGTWMHEEYATLARFAETYPNALAFASSEDAPPRYRSVADAYGVGEDLLAADRRMTALMRDKTLAALKKSGMTRYRLCEDLGLNKGNVYAYLAGDTSKVSRETARRIMEYALA